MLDGYILIKYIHIKIFILIILFCSRIQCHPCQSIETLSFGSDIKIKCNRTYLIFMEKNEKGSQWTFADQNDNCQQKGILESSVNECDVKQINANYLRVPLKVIHRREFACIYCSFDYKPIAPLIHVTRIGDYYTFEITATGLDNDEVFEIIWAQRVHTLHALSINYWFYRTCYHSDIEDFEEMKHSIRFSVRDTNIKRVEFIIRRCHDLCLTKRKCFDDEIAFLTNQNYFNKPDSLEKIVCDQNCLTGTSTSTTTIETASAITDTKAIFSSSTIQLSHEKQTIKSLILFPLLTLLIVLLFIMLACFVIFRRKNLHSHNTYMKTSNINLDEYKQTRQQSK